MFVKIVYPLTGQTGEADLRAFEKVWSKKGWVLQSEPVEPESFDEEDFVESVASFDDETKVEDNEDVEPDDFEDNLPV